MKTFVRQTALLLFVSLAGRAGATGYYGPAVYLDEGGRRVAASPEFYWELEVKRLASNFHPPEKLGHISADLFPGSAGRKSWADGITAEADGADFAAALREGRIKPSDPAEAAREDAAARVVIDQTSLTTTATLPPEFPSEFADYHRGAFAYRQGPEHWAEARQAWENLLQRPAAERHYRTVWATFMLGKMAMKQNDPAAVERFQRTRALAQEGFGDSLHMAADSYGWEGRSEWKQDHPEKAAPLFFTQLALGDESAIVSLKALVPFRRPVEGMLNYGPEPDEKKQWDAQQLQAAQEKAAADLERAARDPLLRRLITAHLLAVASVPDEFVYDPNPGPTQSQRWLKLISNLKLSQLEDAEYLGWVAYNTGDYAGAARWLELASKDAPAGLWLRAKLQRRDGKLKEAAASMAEAWKTLRDPAAYTGSKGDYRDRDPFDFGWQWSFPQSASGDLGALRLERGDFLQALQTLLDGDLWEDAAFVAERVLTTDELQAFVEAHPPPAGPLAEDWRTQLRYLLGRRLVREDRSEKAKAFMPSPWDQVLKKYAGALQTARDKSRSKEERARAFFTAAWLARHEGMELMGTEIAPDGFVTGGAFPVPDVAAQMQSGFYQRVTYLGGETQVAKAPLALRVPASEHRRLTKSKPVPDLRFHYRIIAAALAMEAAKLLPNDSEELSDVVNCAGLWVKDKEEKLADRYYRILEQRAAETAIGRAAIAGRWFVEKPGSWSEREKQAELALRQELHVPDL